MQDVFLLNKPHSSIEYNEIMRGFNKGKLQFHELEIIKTIYSTRYITVNQLYLTVSAMWKEDESKKRLTEDHFHSKLKRLEKQTILQRFVAFPDAQSELDDINYTFSKDFKTLEEFYDYHESFTKEMYENWQSYDEKQRVIADRDVNRLKHYMSKSSYLRKYNSLKRIFDGGSMEELIRQFGELEKDIRKNHKPKKKEPEKSEQLRKIEDYNRALLILKKHLFIRCNKGAEDIIKFYTKHNSFKFEDKINGREAVEADKAQRLAFALDADVYKYEFLISSVGTKGIRKAKYAPINLYKIDNVFFVMTRDKVELDNTLSKIEELLETRQLKYEVAYRNAKFMILTDANGFDILHQLQLNSTNNHLFYFSKDSEKYYSLQYEPELVYKPKVNAIKKYLDRKEAVEDEYETI